MKKILDALASATNSTKESFIKIKKIFSIESTNSKEVLTTYGKHLSGDATKSEMEVANQKFRELLKAIGLGSLCIIPGTVITLPVILIAARKIGIDLLPKSFYDEFPNLKSKNNSSDK